MAAGCQPVRPYFYFQVTVADSQEGERGDGGGGGLDPELRLEGPRGYGMQDRPDVALQDDIAPFLV